MEQLVTIKSYQHGFALYLKEGEAFDKILEEIKQKFENSRQFFGAAKVTLSLEGLLLTPEQEIEIIHTIQNASDLQIMSLVGKNMQLKALFDQAYEQYAIHNLLPEERKPNAFIWRGTVRKGKDIDSSHSIVIIGDVNPGAIVSSEQDIVILGTLLGEAHAGLDGKSGHFVAALDMSPERLSISETRFRKKPSKLFWSDSNKKIPKIAMLDGDQVNLYPITKELLGKLVIS